MDIREDLNIYMQIIRLLDERRCMKMYIRECL